MHTRLLVSDLHRSLQFYRDILGFSVRFGSEDHHYIHLTAPTGGDIGLYPRAMMEEALGASSEAGSGGDSFALVLDVDDVDSEVTRLRDAGVELAADPQDRPLWRERTAHLRDPDGNIVEIKSMLG